MAQQATLQSPDGKQKTVVDVGSSQASQLQSKGWVLGAPANAAIVTVDSALNGIATPVSTTPATPVPPAPTVPPTAPPAIPPATPPPVTPPAPPVAPPAPATPPAAPTVQQATLTSPDGKSKTVVNVGSSEASQLQTRGWKLDASGQGVLSVQDALNAKPSTVEDTTSIETGNDTEDFNLDDYSDFNLNDFTTDPINQSILEKYGITAPKVSDNPVTSFADTYKQLLGTMGISDIKSEFEKTQQKFTDLQTELNDKISEVNDDPWLTEGVRIGRIRSLQDKYEGRLQILTDQQKLYQSMYEQGVQEAQFVANAAFNQQKFDAEMSMNMAQLALQEQEARASLQSTKLRDKLAIAQEMRLSAAQDKEDIQKTATTSLNALKTLADMFGGTVFDNMSDTDKRKWEEQANLPTGTLDHLGQTIEERKLVSGDTNYPASVQEYQFAQTQGYSGSYMDFQLLKKQVDASVANIKPLSGEAAKILSIATTIVPEINQLKVAFEKDYRGSVAGIISGTNRELVKLVDQVADKVGRLRSGGAINKDEEARFKRQISSDMDLAFGDSTTAIAALDGLITEANMVVNSVDPSGSRNVGDFGQSQTTLPALNASYSSIDALLRKQPEYESYIIQQVQNGLDEATILKKLNSGQPITFSSGTGGTPIASIQLGSRLARVNNNPGNLRYVGQAGATQGEGGFAKFETPEAGYQALINQIQLDASRGLTLEKFINKYAPPVENDTSLYLRQMVSAVGASPKTPLKNINLDTLAKAMAKKESSTIIS